MYNFSVFYRVSYKEGAVEGEMRPCAAVKGTQIMVSVNMHLSQLPCIALLCAIHVKYIYCLMHMSIHYILFVLGLYEMIDLYAYKNTPQRLITEAFLMLCALSALICNRHTIKKTGLQIAGPQILFHPWPQIE